MHRLLISSLFILIVNNCYGQTGYLFVKKGGKKKKEYTEYSYINLRLKDGTIRAGMITRLMNDTIYVSGRPIPRVNVSEVLLPAKKKPYQIEIKDVLLATAGAALITGGIALSNQADFQEALIAGVVIGYSPIVIAYAKSKISFRRKKYRIGKKFRLQVLDFYLPKTKGF